MGGIQCSFLPLIQRSQLLTSTHSYSRAMDPKFLKYFFPTGLLILFAGAAFAQKSCEVDLACRAEQQATFNAKQRMNEARQAGNQGRANDAAEDVNAASAKYQACRQTCNTSGTTATMKARKEGRLPWMNE